MTEKASYVFRKLFFFDKEKNSGDVTVIYFLTLYFLSITSAAAVISAIFEKTVDALPIC